MTNSKDENSKISGDFSPAKSQPREEFFPPAYVAMSLELACQVVPHMYGMHGEEFTESDVLRVATKFKEFLEETHGN